MEHTMTGTPFDDDEPERSIQPRDPERQFLKIAMELGLSGGSLDPALLAYATRVVDMCATIADRYREPDNPEDTVGDVIRAHLYD